MSDGSNNSGCFGCITLIVTVMIIWALLFGVTWNGEHHQIGCSFDHGVEAK
jgi:hypothetical protein